MEVITPKFGNIKGMVSKKLLFWLVFIVIVATAFGVIFFLRNPKFLYKPGNSAEIDDVVIASTDLFRTHAKKIDLSSGPCLSNDIRPNWVVDIVHNPREPVDNLPSNQCQAFIEGRAKHFVELDMQGNIIRVK